MSRSRPVARLEAREPRKSRISGPRRHRRLVTAQTHEGLGGADRARRQRPGRRRDGDRRRAIRSSTQRPSARSTSRSRPSARRAAPTRSPGWSHRRSRWPACLPSGWARTAWGHSLASWGPTRVQGGEWPADVIRRAAGVAARSLNGTETVITTLSDLDLSAAIEGLILGAYRFTDFRSSKTAPKDAGLREITVLASRKGGVTKATKQAAERADGDRNRGGHRARSGQHPAEPPVSGRIRQARKGFGRGDGPRGRGARRQSPCQGGLWRRDRRGQGLVAPAPAGPAGPPRGEE